MRKIIFIFLIFCTNTLLGQAPDKNYKFKITSQYSGDEVLSLGSELEITTYQTINWSAPTYSGNWPFSGNITGFSKSGNDITVNFNLSNNPYGHSGTIRINLDRKFLQFFEPSIDYSSRQNKGTYYFEEILDFGDNILIAGEYECSSFKIMNKITPIYSSLLFKNHSLEYEDARGNQRIEFVEVKTNNQKSTGSVMRNNIKFGTFILSENKLTILSEGISLIYDFKLSKEKEERLRVEKQREQNERLRIEKEKQEEDSKLTIEIINYLNENKLSDARYYVGQLNFPEKFPKEYIAKLKSKEDSVIIVEISNSLKNGYPIEASLRFKSLSETNDNYTKYYKIISDSLNRKFSKEYVELDATNEIAKNYIIENKSRINLFKDGVHYIQFDQSGKALDLHNGLTNWTKVPQENINGFLIKKASKLKLNISTNSVRIDSQTQVSTKKPIYTTKKGKKFAVLFLFYGFIYFGENYTKDSVMINQNVPRKKYFVMEKVKNDKMANSILIDSKITEEKIGEGKLHNLVFTRSIASIIVLSPFALRIYENTTVK